jgi:hypothetical protein
MLSSCIHSAHLDKPCNSSPRDCASRPPVFFKYGDRRQRCLNFYTYKVCIRKSFDIQFDKSKNAANHLKHRGVSLAETEAVFYESERRRYLEA